ncbi:hypothetical protein D1632_17005 [Chryseobacterium nematophagum]|uniref:Uncharacterized protein n=1 Tax=Chryseobacterium nematophagum TaxID=2305228 RepID=A0A3M7L7S7_9FLAO|nr:hypothetical protein [Chryseobacterium nematophagum]RMZ58000.1 hypothetical protein D1632_17005 [Chryseobacterium nematophagum]
MTADIFFFITYIFAVLILLLIPYTKNIFKKNIAELFSITSAYLLILADIKNDSKKVIINDLTWEDINFSLVGLGFILLIVSVIVNFSQKNKNLSFSQIQSELQTTTDKLKNIQKEYFKLCSDNIRVIFEDFFTQTDGQGRISIYKFDDNQFKLLGRYSNNPEFNKAGRENYSSNEGFIALGWQNGKFSIDSIPKWTGKGKDYKDFMKNSCNISENILKKIKMKSRSFYIYRIKNEDSRPPLGIIVFEQIKPEVINQVLIENIISGHEAQLQFLIKSMKTIG